MHARVRFEVRGKKNLLLFEFRGRYNRQEAPDSIKTAGTVLIKILRSSHNVQLSIYFISICIHYLIHLFLVYSGQDWVN